MGRIEKVNQQIKREIGRILLQELADPRLQFVTVTDTEVSKDLRHAKISFSVLGGDEQRIAAQNGLESARGMIRRLLGECMNMRYTPELLFIYDQSIEASVRIEETLKEIHDDHETNYSGDQEA